MKIEFISPTVRVTVGEWETRYVPIATNAPKEYDGFGTITIQDDYPLNEGRNNGRLTLVESTNIRWQVGRWQSGLYIVNQEPAQENPAINEHFLRDSIVNRIRRAGDGHDALRVLTKTPALRKLLEQLDPKALRQAEEALSV